MAVFTLAESRPKGARLGAIFGIAVVAYIVLGSLTSALGLYGFALAELIAFGAIPAAALWTWGSRSLAPHRAARAAVRLSQVAGAALLGMSVAVINLLVVAPFASQWMTTPDRLALERALLPPDVPLVTIIAILTLIPALCEEFVFRGLLVRALVPSAGRAVAILTSALAFAFLHGSFARALPTGVLGLVCAGSLVATNRLWPAILIHLSNNALVLTVALSAPGGAPTWLPNEPVIAIFSAVTAALGGYLVRPAAPVRLDP